MRGEHLQYQELSLPSIRVSLLEQENRIGYIFIITHVTCDFLQCQESPQIKNLVVLQSTRNSFTQSPRP